MAEDIKVTEPDVVSGKTNFGVGSINMPTPLWATYVFRAVLYLSAALNVIVSMDNNIPAGMALQIVKYNAIFLILVHMASKMFGIDITKDANDAKSFGK